MTVNELIALLLCLEAKGEVRGEDYVCFGANDYEICGYISCVRLGEDPDGDRAIYLSDETQKD